MAPAALSDPLSRTSRPQDALPPGQALRTANPIESVFAAVRHRTVRTKGALSQKTAKILVLTLVRAASKRWRRLKGANRLPLVVEGIEFTDGVATHDAETRAA